jgi:DNA-binding MarR family transcriptional regulator
MEYMIEKKRVDGALFAFLQSVYLFEKRETQLFSVNWDEVYLLQLLRRQPGIGFSELTTRMKVPKFTLSRMLTRLEETGLIRRDKESGDRRLVQLSLTEDGMGKIAEIEAFNYETVARQFPHMPEEEMEILLRTLEKLDTLLNL